ncbi:MAG: ribokinase [Anaerolineaceae bacterium]|nr:ribokinase [Anaerolineaceae bacterium]
MTDILVLGSLNMDMVVKAARAPEGGETLHGDSFSTIPGGKGANQAAAAARLGGQVQMIGCVGDDVFGPRLLSTLQGFGVDVSGVSTLPGQASGTAVIVVDAGGENRILVIPGANGQVGAAQLAVLEQELAQAKALVLQMEVPLETVFSAIRMAGRQGVPVILNPAPAYPLPDELYAGVAYLVLNESEAELLSGQAVSDLDSARTAGIRLLGKGARHVIVTLGARGALLLAPGQEIYVPTLAVPVVDTTAAGDTFVGAFAAALTHGAALAAALRFAVAAGTLTVTRFGAQTSIPGQDEAAVFMEQLSAAVTQP